ncbi:GRIP1-associated protein 1 isoform X2 [Zonotrichia albicollis]|uniref:GRIP1-associated protein 1 isoform X2 n=1 Tax=Zonotrichia albicollis TaxID=44394 RepID=UPI003D80DEE1
MEILGGFWGGVSRGLLQAELSQLQEEVAKLTEELQEQRERFQRLQEEKEALLRESRAHRDAQELQQMQELQELQELQARGRRLQQELETATKAQAGLRELSECQARELQEGQSQRETLERELRVCSGEREQLRQRLHEAEAAQEALAEQQRLRELLEAEGRALRQELKDVRDGQRILEKKGSAALKDLRRQLQLERRRGERLQERLQELLVPSRARSGLDELGLDGGSSPGRGPGGDSSSVSSLGRDGSAPGSTKSGSGSPGGGSGGGVPAGGGLSPAEVAELFQRLAQSQQERWMLEEKVRHLEVSSASMAEDLCRKSAIIQSFVRESRTEAAGPAGPARRGAGAGPGPGEEGLREMNKKLQNLLEEQLTKNLHLAQDLESLSQELAQLRKEQATPQGPP